MLLLYDLPLDLAMESVKVIQNLLEAANVIEHKPFQFFQNVTTQLPTRIYAQLLFFLTCRRS